MDGSKKGTVGTATDAGITNSVKNLVNGHWGSSYMAAIFFDKDTYNEKGEKDASAPYTALITLNFGDVKTFDAIGYTSGSLQGFAQAQDVFVSDDGVNWTKVSTACYDVRSTPLSSLDTSTTKDPWSNNTPTVEVLFDMGGVSGKYIRIGIIRGGDVSSNTTGLHEINTREIMVYGK
ncbi:MAG: discoidin domain-containing protein [Clostridia bacterium]|nr:discoidin domain-containing protein [Clostridia bacterium]